MNILKAKVRIHDDCIVYEYLVDERKFTLQVPKTKKNKDLVDGQNITVAIGINR
jgi:hypothetical protein